MPDARKPDSPRVRQIARHAGLDGRPLRHTPDTGLNTFAIKFIRLDEATRGRIERTIERLLVDRRAAQTAGGRSANREAGRSG